LNAQYICGINDSGIIQCIKLKSLNASNNRKITNVNHLAKLEILSARCDCGINDAGMVNCINLKKLEYYEDPKITKKLIK